MRGLRRLLTAATCLLLPPRLKPPVLRLLGHRVHRSARIQLSLVQVDRLVMAAGTRIGRLNAIKARRLVMREGAYIGHLNWVSGGLSIGLAAKGAIGHRNHVNGGGPLGRPHRSQLLIGELSKITAGHFVNAGETIRIGDNTVIGGYGTQLWTHGFVHFKHGEPRAEVRGTITIGDNVYIASHCTLQAGIVIGDDVTVGAHASVAKSLLEPGVYVPQELRHLKRTSAERVASLDEVRLATGETYYWRGAGRRALLRAAA